MLSDVAVTPIAETVRRLSAERRSGDLQVRSGRMAKTAFFDHGRLVFASSNLRADRLGEGLVADGRITEQEFVRVSALMGGKRRFGEALVHAGVMDRNEVGAAVGRQVRRIALSLFALTDGVAVFEERPCAVPVDYMVSLSIHRLLYDGIRQMKSETLLLNGLGALDRCVVLTEVPPFAYEPRGNSDELEILELARRRVTLRRLAWTAAGLALPRLRATYALLGAGLLQDADGPPALQPVLHVETGTFLLAAPQDQLEPDGLEAIRREVRQELEQSSRIGRGGWLDRARDTGPSELVRALDQKMERYHELWDEAGDEEPLRTDIETVLGRLAAALRLTSRLLPHAEEVLASDAADEEASVSDEPTAVEATSTASPVPAAARESAAPQRPLPPPDASQRFAALVANGRWEALAAQGAATVPPSTKAPDVSQQRSAAGGAKGRRVSTASPASKRPDESQPTTPGSSTFEGQALIEHLLMEGEVRMTVADYANAVQVYARLVDAQPRVASHHMRLATAMACYPRTIKLAEREFYEAARLDPTNADIHYRWGLYYKVLKVKSRAVAEMRNAVRLNPRHASARAELQALSPKDSALTSLKKLFR